MTRTLSSGGPSWRPAIVSATGGQLTIKPKGIGLVRDDDSDVVEFSEQSPFRGKLRRPKSHHRETQKKVIAQSSKQGIESVLRTILENKKQEKGRRDIMRTSPLT